MMTVGASVLLICREAPAVVPAGMLASKSINAAQIMQPTDTTNPGSRSIIQTIVHPLDAQGSIDRVGRGVRALRTQSSHIKPSGAQIRTGTTSNITAAVAAVASTGTVPWGGSGNPFIVLGVVSNCMWANSFERRQWIRETWKTYANVGKTMHVVFIVALLQSDLSPIPTDMERRLRVEAERYGDVLLLEGVPERKSPCLKTMAWFRHAVRNYPYAPFIAKTDDDAFVHTIKLEANIRPFTNTERVYIGSTLWGSYITKTFEACARRMGPNMCAGGMKEERCKERGAIGPYPYAVGMLQVLSYNVAAWMVAQKDFSEFERRATVATRPPMMDHGEDMVIGMFLYLSPWPLMPLHWGWDKLHDLCFKCTRKDQIWRPITTQTVVAHHIANEEIIKNVFHNITHGSSFDPRPCDDACQRKILPFEVASLADLCSRGGGSIAKVYSKCALVGAGYKTA